VDPAEFAGICLPCSDDRMHREGDFLLARQPKGSIRMLSGLRMALHCGRMMKLKSVKIVDKMIFYRLHFKSSLFL
jgi:hypothetical protein